ncbi:MAG: TrmH family RNA methyltransferase [Pleomorphochaeta sp.]
MITVKKLYTLKDRTQVRKCAAIFHQATSDIFEYEYLIDVFKVLYSDKSKNVLSKEYYKQLDKLGEKLFSKNYDYILFEDISQLLLKALGSEPSDWDFYNDNGSLDQSKRIIYNHNLIIDRVRAPFNIGSIFRSADSFGVKSITLVEGSADITHPRCLRSARGTIETVENHILDEESLIKKLKEEKANVFALELGGTDINNFEFPENGYAIVGSEEFGVSPKLLELCDSSLKRVSIPLVGTKGSINVSVATGIMLQHWMSVSSSTNHFK